MKFAFRVDASNRMGVGHLMRCLTLAKELRNRNAEVLFICREHPGHLISTIQGHNFAVAKLPAPSSYIENGEDYATWLGVTQAEDAKATIEALAGEAPDWIVVDHYGLDIEWERAMRPHVGKLMVIDDLANRRHDCDVLLDQNYNHTAETRYRNLVQQHCIMLLGPRYALLSREYASYREKLPPHSGTVSRVLIFFGGSDPCNMTGVALEALSKPELAHLNVDVVIGANNGHQRLIEELAKRRSRVSIHFPRPHLADLMVQADLAIGAGGATTWERMCLGVPTIVIPIAENQIPATRALADDGLIEYIKSDSGIVSRAISEAVQKLVVDSERLAEMSAEGKNLVDGLGSLRTVETVMPSLPDDASLRSAKLSDMSIYFDWVNDSIVRQSAIDSNPILWNTHRVWFEKKVLSANSCLFVMEAANLPIGQIRFDRDEEGWTFDYSIDAVVRGRGWGHILIALGVSAIWKVKPVRVQTPVKRDNQPSRSVLRKLGFRETGASDDGVTIFQLDPQSGGRLIEQVGP